MKWLYRFDGLERARKIFPRKSFSSLYVILFASKIAKKRRREETFIKPTRHWKVEKTCYEAGKQRVKGKKYLWNPLKKHQKNFSPQKSFFFNAFFPGKRQTKLKKAVLMKIHQIFKLKPIINVYSCHWRKGAKRIFPLLFFLLLLLLCQLLQKNN